MMYSAITPMKSKLGYNAFLILTMLELQDSADEKVSKDILLAQKIFASVNRKRIMGRDFFDIVFLYGIGAKSNFDYLKKNIDVSTVEELKKYMLEKTANLDFEELARDVEPLLFDSRDKQKVLLFREFMELSF